MGGMVMSSIGTDLYRCGDVLARNGEVCMGLCRYGDILAGIGEAVAIPLLRVLAEGSILRYRFP
jgi:hypothetical protein